MKYRKGTFITVPNKEQLSGLDPQTQVLYMWLNSYANDDGECFPSIERLAVDCGMSRDTVIRRLEVLCEKGLVKKQNQYVDNRQTTNLYTMELLGEGSTEQPPQSHTATPGGSTEQHRTQSIVTQPIELGVSKETQDSTFLPKEELSGNTTSRKSIKEEYDVVPVTEEGDEVAPRKKPQTWDVEKRVFETFVSKAKEYTGVEPEPAKLWQLKQIRSVLPKYSKQEILEIFDDWFNEAPDTVILNIHSALSAHNLNKYKMKK